MLKEKMNSIKSSKNNFEASYGSSGFGENDTNYITQKNFHVKKIPQEQNENIESEEFLTFKKSSTLNSNNNITATFYKKSKNMNEEIKDENEYINEKRKNKVLNMIKNAHIEKIRNFVYLKEINFAFEEIQRYIKQGDFASAKEMERELNSLQMDVIQHNKELFSKNKLSRSHATFGQSYNNNFSSKKNNIDNIYNSSYKKINNYEEEDLNKDRKRNKNIKKDKRYNNNININNNRMNEPINLNRINYDRNNNNFRNEYNMSSNYNMDNNNIDNVNVNNIIYNNVPNGVNNDNNMFNYIQPNPEQDINNNYQENINNIPQNMNEPNNNMINNGLNNENDLNQQKLNEENINQEVAYTDNKLNPENINNIEPNEQIENENENEQIENENEQIENENEQIENENENEQIENENEQIENEENNNIENNPNENDNKENPQNNNNNDIIQNLNQNDINNNNINQENKIPKESSPKFPSTLSQYPNNNNNIKINKPENENNIPENINNNNLNGNNTYPLNYNINNNIPFNPDNSLPNNNYPNYNNINAFNNNNNYPKAEKDINIPYYINDNNNNKIPLVRNPKKNDNRNMPKKKVKRPKSSKGPLINIKNNNIPDFTYPRKYYEQNNKKNKSKSKSNSRNRSNTPKILFAEPTKGRCFACDVNCSISRSGNSPNKYVPYFGPLKKVRKHITEYDGEKYGYYQYKPKYEINNLEVNKI